MTSDQVNQLNLPEELRRHMIIEGPEVTHDSVTGEVTQPPFEGPKNEEELNKALSGLNIRNLFIEACRKALKALARALPELDGQPNIILSGLLSEFEECVAGGKDDQADLCRAYQSVMKMPYLRAQLAATSAAAVASAAASAAAAAANKEQQQNGKNEKKKPAAGKVRAPPMPTMTNMTLYDACEARDIMPFLDSEAGASGRTPTMVQTVLVQHEKGQPPQPQQNVVAVPWVPIPILDRNLGLSQLWYELTDPVNNGEKLAAESTDFFWIYILEVNKFARLFNALPEGIATRAEKVACNVAADIARTGGRRRLELDMVGVGVEVMKGITNNEVNQLAGNFSELFNAIGGVGAGSQAAAAGVNVSGSMIDALAAAVGDGTFDNMSGRPSGSSGGRGGIRSVRGRRSGPGRRGTNTSNAASRPPPRGGGSTTGRRR